MTDGAPIAPGDFGPAHGAAAPPGFGDVAWPYGDLAQAPMVGPGYPPALPKQANGYAVASLVAGIISILGSCACFLALPAAIAAFMLGRAGLARVRDEPDRFGGRPLAVAGMACAAGGLLLTVVLIVMNVTGVSPGR